MWLPHIAVHSLMRSIPENNILIWGDVSQHKRLYGLHTQKKTFSSSLNSPASPLTHAEKLMFSSPPSKSPLPMRPEMIQQHNDGDPIWGTKSLFLLMKTDDTLILWFAHTHITVTRFGFVISHSFWLIKDLYGMHSWACFASVSIHSSGFDLWMHIWNCYVLTDLNDQQEAWGWSIRSTVCPL